LVEVWRTNSRINTRLLDRIDEAGLRCTLSKRAAAPWRQFGHLHYVRIYHLRHRPSTGRRAKLFATEDEPSRKRFSGARRFGTAHRALDPPGP